MAYAYCENCKNYTGTRCKNDNKLRRPSEKCSNHQWK